MNTDDHGGVTVEMSPSVFSVVICFHLCSSVVAQNPAGARRASLPWLASLLLVCWTGGVRAADPTTADHPREKRFDELVTVARLFDLTTGEARPTIAGFYYVFGPNNEAEIDLILQQRFGTLVTTDAMVEFVNEQLASAAERTSRVLECLRSEQPKIFAGKGKRQIEIPPERHGELLKIKVFVGGKVVTVEFSGGERFVETLRVSSGPSLDEMLENCGRRRDEEEH